MWKKSLNIFFEHFICEKYLFWKHFRFLGPFFGGGDYNGRGKFVLLFSSHFESLLLQLQTLQVSEGVLGQKYFLNRPWSQKNLMSSWGGRWCRCSVSASVFCSLARAHSCYNVFTFHSILTSTHKITFLFSWKKKLSPPKW